MKKFLFMAFAVTFSAMISSTAFAERVTVKAGTAIMATLDETVTSESATIGQSVSMHLVSPIKVGETGSIPAGTLVNAQVSDVDGNGCFGRKGTLSLRLVSFLAPDGTQVPIQAHRSAVGKDKMELSIFLGVFICPLFWLMHGKEADLPAGTNINATVLANTDIDI